MLASLSFCSRETLKVDPRGVPFSQEGPVFPCGRQRLWGRPPAVILSASEGSALYPARDPSLALRMTAVLKLVCMGDASVPTPLRTSPAPTGANESSLSCIQPNP